MKSVKQIKTRLALHYREVEWLKSDLDNLNTESFEDQRKMIYSQMSIRHHKSTIQALNWVLDNEETREGK